MVTWTDYKRPISRIIYPNKGQYLKKGLLNCEDVILEMMISCIEP
jgi:hypothetical protein